MTKDERDKLKELLRYLEAIAGTLAVWSVGNEDAGKLLFNVRSSMDNLRKKMEAPNDTND